MNAHLPADLEQFVQAKVRSGRFSSSDEAITAAVRLLRQQEEAEESRVLEGIRQGLEDVRAGRTEPLAQAFADIRRDLNLPHCLMKFRIELAATAKADIRGQAQWLRENVSPAAATKWLDGLTRSSILCKPGLCGTQSPRRATSSPRKSTSCSTASVASGNTSTGSSSPSARRPSKSSMSVTPPATNWSRDRPPDRFQGNRLHFVHSLLVFRRLDISDRFEIAG